MTIDPAARVAVLSRSFSANETLRAELAALYPDIRFNDTGRTLAGDELAAFLDGRDHVIVAMEKIDAAALARSPQIKVIAKYGVGVDNIDLAACAARGVRVGWRGGVNRRSVAELTLAFMIMALREAPQAQSELAGGIWRQRVGRQLSDATVGLIGFGHVGQEVAELLNAFGARVVVHDIRDLSAQLVRLGASARSLDALLAEADVVSLHVPLTPRTAGMIGAAAIARMRPGAVLVNTARGGLVDEPALAAALQAGKIAAAAFDVLAEEPPPPDHPLIDLPNVIVTPHIGGSAREAILAMGRAAIDGLADAGDPLALVPDYLRTE